MPLDHYFKYFFLKLGQSEEWGFAIVLSPSIGTIFIWKVEFVLWEKRNVIADAVAINYYEEGIVDWAMIKFIIKRKLKRGKQHENS